MASETTFRPIGEEAYEAAIRTTGGTLPAGTYRVRAGDHENDAPGAIPPKPEFLAALYAALLADDDERRSKGSRYLYGGRGAQLVSDTYAPFGGPHVTPWSFRFGTDRGYDLGASIDRRGNVVARRVQQGRLESDMAD